jgi:hypothetical protein
MTSRPLDDPELLVTQGGQLHRALRRAGFETPAPAATTKAAVVVAAAAWVPLLVLYLAQVPSLGPVSVPFFQDFSTGLRFLVTLPLLVYAGSFVEPRLAAVARHFAEAELVPAELRPRFHATIERALQLRDALLPQFLIMVLALGLSLVGQTNAVSAESSWHAVSTASGLHRTWAGWAYDYFTLPLYRVVVLTWVWRYLLWIWFLWRSSRLQLRIVPSHPDLSGGLAFIGVGQSAFSILVVAFSIGAAGIVGMQAVHEGSPLASLYPLIGGYLAVILAGVLGPLFICSPLLWNAKRRGLYRYGTLGSEYTTAFERKWMEPRPEDGEALLGSADIQSLADLGNSFNVVRQMRLYPFEPRVVAILTAAAVGPFLPLALIQYPISQILTELFHLLL